MLTYKLWHHPKAGAIFSAPSGLCGRISLDSPTSIKLFLFSQSIPRDKLKFDQRAPPTFLAFLALRYCVLPNWLILYKRAKRTGISSFYFSVLSESLSLSIRFMISKPMYFTPTSLARNSPLWLPTPPLALFPKPLVRREIVLLQLLS